MKEAKELKDIEWQEFFIACDLEGMRYFDVGDYENALNSFQQSVDVIERFMLPDKTGFEAYSIGGTHANHAITVLHMAVCLFRLGRMEDIDALIDKSRHIYFDAYENMYENKDMGVEKYVKYIREQIDYFTEEYHSKKLDEYKPLDLSDIEKRIDEKLKIANSGQMGRPFR